MMALLFQLFLNICLYFFILIKTNLLLSVVAAHRISISRLSLLPATLIANSRNFLMASWDAALNALMTSCGLTPSSTKGLAAFKNSAAKITTLIDQCFIYVPFQSFTARCSITDFRILTLRNVTHYNGSRINNIKLL